MIRLASRRARWIAIAAVVAAAIVGLLLVSGRLPELDADDLARARARWRETGLDSYDLTLTMAGTGLDAGRYRVQVRAGAVHDAKRDDLPLTGDLSAYTVDGLLRLVATELELAAEPSRSYGAPPGYRAYLFARFDDRGVPVQFRRVVGGTSRWAEWTIEEIVPR